MGDVEYWYSDKPKDADMRIPDNMRDCACFLCTQSTDGKYHIGGTAFFLNFRSAEQSQLCWMYLVTAKHCVIEWSGSVRQLYARIPTESGDARYVKLVNEWVFPSDPGSDVAIMEFAPEAPFKFGSIDFSSSATSKNVEKHDIGIGNETLTIGLFALPGGRAINLPIVRSGMISAMAEEPIDLGDGRKASVHLVEMRSITGLSGSPVFVHVPKIQLGRGAKGAGDPYPAGFLFLLGVVSGHFNAQPQLTYATDRRDSRDDGVINAGIAIVTPISEVLQTVSNDEKLYAARRKREREFVSEHAVTLDSAFPPDESEPQFRKSDFENALKKVSQKLPRKK